MRGNDRVYQRHKSIARHIDTQLLANVKMGEMGSFRAITACQKPAKTIAQE